MTAVWMYQMSWILAVISILIAATGSVLAARATRYAKKTTTEALDSLKESKKLLDDARSVYKSLSSELADLINATARAGLKQDHD
jgi:uncharacterized membrane-anchored protein YhcB (DUF1043 family)